MNVSDGSASIALTFSKHWVKNNVATTTKLVMIAAFISLFTLVNMCLLAEIRFYFIYVDIEQIGNYGLGLLVFGMLIWSALYNIAKMNKNE
tara:strand:+ start:104 stop:376 length:273 start_codon:yes stop_codon:yes gene_type:complete